MPSAPDPESTRSTTVCPLDCPDACTLDVTVRDDKVVKIDGANGDPHTDGYICGKVRRFADHVYADQRLKTPLRRSGAKGKEEFVAISWEQAFEELTSRIEQDRSRFGAESILPLCYGGSNGKLTQDALDARFFFRLGASQLERTVCAAPSGAAYNAMYGKMPGVSCLDYDESQMIVVWGNNPHASGIHQVPHVQNAQRNGAKLVVVDPRETPLAAKADLHLPLFPGTDLVVALAMIRWLNQNGFADRDFLDQHTTGFDELIQCGDQWDTERAASIARVPKSDLETFFSWYGETTPAVIRCGWGPERNRNGGSATAAILAIPAVANKFTKAGGFTMSNSAAWRLNQASVIQATPPSTRKINMNLIGESLLQSGAPPISTLFVYNCNPVATLPEQNKVIKGLLREDLFTVVFDQVMTDTARYADLILPATTFLEHHDLRNGYGNTRMGRVTPVIDPVGESKSNNEVFAELIRRLGLEQPGDIVDDQELSKALLGKNTFAQLEEDGQLLPDVGTRPVQMKDVRPATASGKIELFPESLQQSSGAGLYQYIEDQQIRDEYPLALISPSTRTSVNSSLAYLEKKQAVVTMHPQDASERDLRAGQTVRVFNAIGEVIIELQVAATVAPGVVSLAKGIWMQHTKNHRTSNALSPDTLSDIGAGACFNDARVQVEGYSKST